ncbi:hypothetical protein MJM28_28695, partial [Salmonella enterica subsp. enterica serovar Montevideo]|nr:hypothetical protein [Salmonella enterica subsp. enterica serovar Montevideo]
GRQSLQEARLLATTGHTEQAIASYDKLFKGYPPEGELAVEYCANRVHAIRSAVIFSAVTVA